MAGTRGGSVAAAETEESKRPVGAGWVLPALHTVRLSGLESRKLAQFVKFRRAQGRPVKLWLLDERMRDAELEKMQKEMLSLGSDESIEWFKSEEDEEDEDDDEDAEGYTDDEGAEEEITPPGTSSKATQIPEDIDDEHVDYSDEEEDEDEED